MDLEPTSDQLVSPDGDQPVWPVRTAEERDAILQVAKLFGAEARVVLGRPGRVGGDRDEVVVARGSEAAPIGALYAQLTGRSFRHATSDAEILSPTPPAVLVTTFANLAPEVLSSLYATPTPRAPGIVCGTDTGDLRTQALVRAAAAHLTGPGTSIVAPLPALSLGLCDRTGIPLRKDAGVDVRSRLAGPLGVLTITTHSDGVDAYLGENLTLCPVVNLPETTGKARPACVVSGFCHRHDDEISWARDSGRLLAPDEISARVLVLDGCYGVLVAGSPVDPSLGLAAQLVANPDVGCVVTTWDVNFGDERATQALRHQLERGCPVGDAVAMLNRSESVRRRAGLFCLLGDPRLRASVGAWQPSGATFARKGRTVALHGPGDDDLAELAFSRARLEIAVARQTKDERDAASQSDLQKRQLTSARRTLDALVRYERLQWTNDSGHASFEPAARELRRQLIEDNYRRGELVQDWLPMVDWKSVDWRTCACWACGREGKSTDVTLRIPGVSSRRLLVCATCGIVEDVSARLPLRFQLDRDRGYVRLETELPKDRWAGALILRSHHEPACRIATWPSLDSGQAASGVLTPLPWPEGPLSLSVIIISGWTISMAGHRLVVRP